ncbi:cilia- and flagella-associated protein 91-like [Drosophila sulfurigaster albostrigata]|uniref:cilia- and flagella-associated protein 91-like n=1 Tax=Drosophila sulfurigaster albostrigata TaxID=89887 RepID=UPI002D218C9F|nr:cilia- and flagella-associated protein 91-like [Drosophila sulfurigaster albostrigata]
MPAQETGVMNVLFEARRMRNSSSTSRHSGSSPRVAPLEVKRVKSKESVQLLVEPPKHAKRVTFSKQKQQQQQQQQQHQQRQQTVVKDSEMQTGLTSCLITNPTLEPRATGGANNPAERKVGWLARTDSECQFKAPGIDFLTERDTNVITFEVKMRDSLQSVKDYTTKCDYFPKFVDKRPFKDQATQTLYRESSAQTLAYLPDIVDKEQSEHLELFNLATLLPGDKPPGLYEVEILERARKRWAFNQALKTNFMQQLHEARESAINSKYRPILEAFEWEQWIEREEYIQECQMMRLKIVIRMFDKRERQMHTASKTRIEEACATIEKRRQHGLNKNEIKYQRAMRRLQIEHSGTSRRWKKQSPMQALGSPCSEFYGPLIRHGVDPARRNFVGDGRKAFDMRIDSLEKRVDMDKLECPFTKLKEWSKPKEYVKEYEQNFCSDKHLQKLYESLKTLRSQATRQKTAPKCLKRRPKVASEVDARISYNYEDVDARDFFMDRARRSDVAELKVGEELSPEQILAIRNFLEDEERRTHSPDIAEQMIRERRTEDLEQLLHIYEGGTIGWIMQFLSEEMERLKEQRKLHFFSILAQKERWRREAAEAGLRQKENNLRILYEDIFQQSNVVNNEVTEDYINTILTTDMAHIAENNAAESVIVLAKQIDADIQRWLDNIKLVQTPLTYEPLRELLRAMVFPDLNTLVIKYEKTLIAKYIIDDVLFGRIWEELETYDIATVIGSDLIDRLIDNDLYLFSTESEGETPRPRTANIEVEAILRKVIRQAVPGRRWKTETERVAHENCNDLFDGIFDRILEEMNRDIEPMEPVELHQAFSRQLISKRDNIRELEEENLQKRRLDETVAEGEIENIMHLKTQVLSLLKKMKGDKITKALDTDEHYLGDAKVKIEDDQSDALVHLHVYKEREKISEVEGDVHSIVSMLDVTNEEHFATVRHPGLETDIADDTSSSRMTYIGVEFGTQTKKRPEDQLIHAFHELIDGTVPSDAYTEYEADDESSWWPRDDYVDEGKEEELLMSTDTVLRQQSSSDASLKGTLKRPAVSRPPSRVGSLPDSKLASQVELPKERIPRATSLLIDEEEDEHPLGNLSSNKTSNTFFDARDTKKFSGVSSHYDLTAPNDEVSQSGKSVKSVKSEDKNSQHRE